MPRLTATLLIVLVLILASVALAQVAYNAGASDFRANLVRIRSEDERCPIVLYEDSTFGCRIAD